MFLLSSTYEDFSCESYSFAEVLGFFSTFDKANEALKTILNELGFDEKTGKEETHGSLYAITFDHSNEVSCYVIQEIEVDVILHDLQL